MILKINFPKRGQKLTNGDVIRMLFPNIEISNSEELSKIYTGIPYNDIIGANIDATKDWWNAVYEVPNVKKMCSNGYIGEVE